MAIWQGDFGTGQSTGSGVWGDPGANPCKAYGPIPAAGVSSQGIPQPQFRLGMVMSGDLGAEFVYGKLVLASVTDLTPGLAYQLDKDYNMTLLTTSNSVLNEEVVFAQVWAPQLAAGTYYIWGQRAGRAAGQVAAASVATGFGETTATAGVLKYPASATAGSKSVSPSSSYLASAGFTFTCTTTSGSPTLTNVSSILDLAPGAALAGTGIPANAIATNIRKTGNTWAIDMGTSGAGNLTTLQNATANGSAIVTTVTGILPINLDWPTLNKAN